MAEPATRLDSRFSEPGASATTWSDALQVIAEADLFWITTVRQDGRPNVSPLVAVWLDGAIYFATGQTEQKAVNLRTNPNVVLTTGCNSWEHGLDVVVEGIAVPATDRGFLERLASVWATKWDGRWRYEARDGGFSDALVYEVRPTKVLAFGRGAFTQTTHTFK
jgi:general stress protein 26